MVIQPPGLGCLQRGPASRLIGAAERARFYSAWKQSAESRRSCERPTEPRSRPQTGKSTIHNQNSWTPMDEISDDEVKLIFGNEGWEVVALGGTAYPALALGTAR